MKLSELLKECESAIIIYKDKDGHMKSKFYSPGNPITHRDKKNAERALSVGFRLYHRTYRLNDRIKKNKKEQTDANNS